MKVAVIGGGTAGCIAAVHLTSKLPEARLLHVFDSSIPTIGVGEGTTPRFPLWLEEVTGLGFSDVEARCRATLKRGTRYRGWGRAGTPFRNLFQPLHLIGYHFNATDVAQLLRGYVKAEHIDARVDALITREDGAYVRLSGGVEHRCDYVFDARGFPRLAEHSRPPGSPVKLDWIPTNRAVIRGLPAGDCPVTSDSIARPHGWIFRVPLIDSISCGYVFNSRLSSDAEVETDFDAFLGAEGVTSWESRRAMSFPNFLVRRWFDGRVFRVGNAASFVEPLEATAIGTSIVQVRTATDWIVEHGPGSSGDPQALDALNDFIFSYVCRNSLFIAWHYLCGSTWDTAFWSHARRGIDRAWTHDIARTHLEAMEEFVAAGRELPGPSLCDITDPQQWQREVYPLLRVFRPFGNFSELNFAQVGHGIGAYGHGPRADRTIAAAADQ